MSGTVPDGPDPLDRAIFELCLERGLQGVTIDGLCSRAGLGQEEFDARYSDLEECFAEAYEKCAQEFLGRVTAAFESKEAWRDRLRAAAYATLLHLEEDPARANFTVVEAPKAGERARLVRDRVLAALFSFVDRGRLEPVASERVSEMTAESLNGAVFQQMRVAIESSRHERFADVLPELMYAVVLPYLGPEAAAEELEIPVPRPG